MQTLNILMRAILLSMFVGASSPSLAITCGNGIQLVLEIESSADQQFTLTVCENGYSEYIGKDFVKTLGKITYTLNPQEMQALNLQIKKLEAYDNGRSINCKYGFDCGYTTLRFKFRISRDNIPVEIVQRSDGRFLDDYFKLLGLTGSKTLRCPYFAAVSESSSVDLCAIEDGYSSSLSNN